MSNSRISHKLLTRNVSTSRSRSRRESRSVGSSSIYLTVPRERLALPAETAHPTAATMDGDFVASFGGRR